MAGGSVPRTLLQFGDGLSGGGSSFQDPASEFVLCMGSTLSSCSLATSSCLTCPLTSPSWPRACSSVKWVQCLCGGAALGLRQDQGRLHLTRTQRPGSSAVAVIPQCSANRRGGSTRAIRLLLRRARVSNTVPPSEMSVHVHAGSRGVSPADREAERPFPPAPSSTLWLGGSVPFSFRLRDDGWVGRAGVRSGRWSQGSSLLEIRDVLITPAA